MDGAYAELLRWQDVIAEIAEQRQVHPSINQIRFESATRAMASLDQLEARLIDVLTTLGTPYRRARRAGRRPAPPRRWPPELAGVAEFELQGEHLARLTYAQLHAFAMADHPDEVDALADQWLAMSHESWERGIVVLGSIRYAPDLLCVQLAQLADAYWAFAARTDHYATTFRNAAVSERQARTRLEELGPP